MGVGSHVQLSRRHQRHFGLGSLTTTKCASITFLLILLA